MAPGASLARAASVYIKRVVLVGESIDTIRESALDLLGGCITKIFTFASEEYITVHAAHARELEWRFIGAAA